MKSPLTRAGLTGIALLSAGALLAGCAGGGSADSADGTTTVTVAIDAGLEKEARDAEEQMDDVVKDGNLEDPQQEGRGFVADD